MTRADKDLGYVWDMHDAACQIREFSEGKSFEHYAKDKMLRLAIERLLEIMGQAAKEISQEYQQKNQNVPWLKLLVCVMS